MRQNHLRTRVKICGICREEDRDAAVAVGADSIGLVFCAASPRHLDVEEAARLRAGVPVFVSAVALLMDPESALVEAVIERVKPDLLQFHGREAPEFCQQFGRPYIKAIGMQDGVAAARRQMQQHRQASGFICDSHASGQMGGTGQVFDWSQLPEAQAPVILAGGLRSGNVADAVRIAKPYAVDVSSGVEAAPGIKSAARMADFMRAVRLVDAERIAGSE